MGIRFAIDVEGTFTDPVVVEGFLSEAGLAMHPVWCSKAIPCMVAKPGPRD